MTAYDDVLKELRQLRRSKAHRPIDFKNTPHLVWHTGRGNIDVTTNFLKKLGSVDDTDILAALASIGYESLSANIEDRMNEFAAKYNEESTRTVRRWADEGFEKIARLVIEWSEEAGNDGALVEIFVHQTGPSELEMVATGSGPPDMVMLMPSIAVNHERYGLPPPSTDNSETDNDDESGVRDFYFATTVSVELLMDEPVAAILEVEWLGAESVRYEAQIHPSIRDYVTTSLVTKKGCEIQLVRVGGFPIPMDATLSSQAPDNVIIE